MSRPPFLRFLDLCRPFAGRMVLAVALVLVSTALTLPAPWILKEIIDRALPQRDLRLLGLLLSLFAGIFLVRAALTMVRNRILQYTTMRMVCDLRIQLFAHLQTLPLRYFDTNQTGEIASRISHDVSEVYNLANGFLLNLVADTVTIVAVLAFLFFVDWRLAAAASAVLPLFVLNYLHNRRRMQHESRVHRESCDRLLGFLHEKVSGARVIKTFVREEQEISAFTAWVDNDYHAYSRIVLRNTRLAVVADVLASVAALVVLGFGGWLVIRGEMGLGTLIAFNAYTAYVFPPIVRFVDLAAVFQRAHASIENIFALWDTRPDLADAPDARPMPPLRGEVEFRGVSFHYDAGAAERGRGHALADVSFRVPAGRIVAIVGPSGSGKSTLINLLARFYDPVAGEVQVDGTDLRQVRIDSYRAQIGIVPQDTLLFSGTIEENLRYGKAGATLEEIIAAADAANAHEFIMKLPDGYRTKVGERGAQLSGGQRQRIAIARAILRDPRILIFDEATSALDLASERLIRLAMERVMRGRTTFIIAHRLSTIEQADHILVMNEGRLVEHGTHEELLALGGDYAHLHALHAHAHTPAAD